MLNERQTSYMIAKYLAKYPPELINKNPLIAIEAFGYICAIIDSTDSKELRSNLREIKEKLFNNVIVKLASVLEVNHHDKL